MAFLLCSRCTPSLGLPLWPLIILFSYTALSLTLGDENLICHSEVSAKITFKSLNWELEKEQRTETWLWKDVLKVFLIKSTLLFGMEENHLNAVQGCLQSQPCHSEDCGVSHAAKSKAASSFWYCEPCLLYARHQAGFWGVRGVQGRTPTLSTQGLDSNSNQVMQSVGAGGKGTHAKL